MYRNFNPVEEYVQVIKQNANFLNRLLSPKIGLPLLAFGIMVVGLIVIVR